MLTDLRTGGIGASQLRTSVPGSSSHRWSSTGCLALVGAAASIGELKLCEIALMYHQPAEISLQGLPTISYGNCTHSKVVHSSNIGHCAEWTFNFCHAGFAPVAFAGSLDEQSFIMVRV